MPTYTPPLKDLRFVLHDVLRIDARADIEGYAELTPDVTAAIFEEAGKLASEVLAPLNEAGDSGCVLENGVVRTPEGFRDGWARYRAGEWSSLECDPDYGGQGLPNVIGWRWASFTPPPTWPS